MLENKPRVKALLSFSPGKPRDNVFRLRARGGGKLEHLPSLALRETPIDSSPLSPLSSRKRQLSSGGLFRSAHQVVASDTFLPEKTHGPTTNASSSPTEGDAREGRLQRPLQCARNERSQSNLGKEEGKKMIQRTISIAIGGKNGEASGNKEVMDTLSRLILGESEGQDFFLEYLDESSIHGPEENFLELDSCLLEGIIHSEQYTLKE